MLSDEVKERKKQELLEKCFELFVQKGLENTSLNELASYCNMHKVTFYSYLKSKDEIVIDSAKQYMEKMDKIFLKILQNPKSALKEELEYGFNIITREKDKFRYIYQVVSSPKYGSQSRYELTKVYMRYLDYSKELAKIYNVNHTQLRPYFLLYIATIHDYCLWENEGIVKEKLDYIYSKISDLKHKEAV